MSESSRHVLRRLELEVRTPRDRCVPALHDTLSRIVREKFIPELEVLCDALDPGAAHVRVPRVEVDLGTVPIRDLEAALTRALQEALGDVRHQVAKETSRALPAAEAGDALLERFLTTGQLPWWAGNGPKGSSSLDHCLQRLAERPPSELRAWLIRCLATPRALPRLVARASDEILQAVLERALGEAWTSLEPAWRACLALVSSRGTPTGIVLGRGPLWQAGLRAVLETPHPTVAISNWWEAFARHLSQVTGYPTSLWKAQLGQLCDSAEFLPEPTLSQASPELELSSLPQAFLACLERLDTASRERVRQALAGGSSADRSTLQRVLQEIVEEGRLSVEDLHAALSIEPVSSEWAARLKSALPPTPRKSREAISSGPRPPAFDEGDDVRVFDAGLVLVWPFLAGYLERLELTSEGRFVSPAAQQRAVGLLHALANPQPRPREEQVTLGKVLCGWPLEEVFEWDEPLTERESAESDTFLETVLRQAPMLGRLSVEGFRSSFLIREAQLSARDGSWFLRVERRDYDIILDRLPWPWRWVRLRWMQSPLQIEW